MAFKIDALEEIVADNSTLLIGMFGCYDTIGDPSFDMDRDETLHERSAFEFVRDQLTPDQQAELDVVDAYWRAHPKEFNEDFAVFHIRENKKTALEAFVWDENGNTPEIPRSHWWWYPIKAED